MTHEPFYAAALLARARHEANCEDFGTDSFIEPLSVLLDSLNEVLDQLHDKGRVGFENWLIRLLVNRLRMQRDIMQHPEIATQTLLPPAAIIGLPRTGSTKLQRVLAAGHGLQELLMWQAFNPAPFPNAHAGERDPRIQAAVDHLDWVMADAPDSQKGHPMMVEQVEEENHLIEQSFEAATTITYVPVYRWAEWIAHTDKTAMYRHLRTCLQYLQWQFHRDAPRPWLLKHPGNLGSETCIDALFPGVRYIVTHRDPFPVMASLSQYIAAAQKLYCVDSDIRRFSRWALDDFALKMDHHLAWRDAHPEAKILDIGFGEIVRDGLGVARRVYDFLDIEWTANVEADILGWLEQNERERDKLEYSFDHVAYSEAECRERFADYYRRFQPLLS